MHVRLLYFDGCPNWARTGEALENLAEELGFTLVHQAVETLQEAERVGFRGSPTILVDGRDPFAQGDDPTCLACRLYDAPNGAAGSPTVEQLRSALA